MAMKARAVDSAIAAMRDAGLKLSAEEIRSRIDAIYKERGIEFQNVFDELLFREFKYIDYKILCSGIIAYRRAREASLVTYPHVHATLITLAKMHLKLGVVSDAPAREAWMRLCYLNLHQLFDVVVTFDDSGERKPHPKPFLTALNALGVAPQDSIMIGDWAERDILGARQLGMKTVFARYGDTFGTEHPNADYEITDVAELITIVNTLNGQSS